MIYLEARRQDIYIRQACQASNKIRSRAYHVICIRAVTLIGTTVT